MGSVGWCRVAHADRYIITEIIVVGSYRDGGTENEVNHKSRLSSGIPSVILHIVFILYKDLDSRLICLCQIGV